MAHQSWAPKPLPVSLTVEALARYLQDELSILAHLFQEEVVLELRQINAAPHKPRIGMIVYADGTDWNPDGASGEGLYVYKSGGWTFIA